MTFKMIDFLCHNCNLRNEYLLERTATEPFECPSCREKTCYIVPSAPAIRTSDSATFLDGTKRKGFQELKEAARLEVLKANMDSPQERTLISNEINKLKAVK